MEKHFWDGQKRSTVTRHKKKRQPFFGKTKEDEGDGDPFIVVTHRRILMQKNTSPSGESEELYPNV